MFVCRGVDYNTDYLWALRGGPEWVKRWRLNIWSYIETAALSSPHRPRHWKISMGIQLVQAFVIDR